MFYGHEKEFRSFAELKKAVDEYVDWYNNERIVQRLGGAEVISFPSLLSQSLPVSFGSDQDEDSLSVLSDALPLLFSLDHR